MRNLLKSVSLMLALLLLAPPAIASARCLHCAHESGMERNCCAGMQENAMPGYSAAQTTNFGAQLSAASCCAFTQTELSLPASLPDAQPLDGVLFMTSIAVSEPAPASASQQPFEEYPPGARPIRATLTNLCTFLI